MDTVSLKMEGKKKKSKDASNKEGLLLYHDRLVPYKVFVKKKKYIEIMQDLQTSSWQQGHWVRHEEHVIWLHKGQFSFLVLISIISLWQFSHAFNEKILGKFLPAWVLIKEFLDQKIFFELRHWSIDFSWIVFVTNYD